MPTIAESAFSAAVDAAATVPVRSVDALWRLLNYLCAAQLYLQDNVDLRRPLQPEHIKAAPSGHWGTCPPVNLVLAHLSPLLAFLPTGSDLRIVHGAGHAGPSALAFAYLNGALGRQWPRFAAGPAGLRALVASFPHQDSIGGEISPLIPPHIYMGGQLGPVLAFAQGTVLDAPHRLTVALVGDGECETGTTAAAWLGRQALPTGPTHGRVLPIVLLNGLRMGSRTLLAGLDPEHQVAYFSGMGYHPYAVDGVEQLRPALHTALRLAWTENRPPVILLRIAKGLTGPESVDGRQILGTPAVHKAPLRAPRTNRVERAALARWLASYRPTELLTSQGTPTPVVSVALPTAPPEPETPPAIRNEPVVDDTLSGSFGTVVTSVLRRHAAAGNLRVFSPDELSSNRVPLEGQAWVTEVLNEELCHLWAQGYVETGRRGVVLTYEAFAPVNTSLLQQYLKYRAMTGTAGRPSIPSLTYVLTSLGWHNNYSHQNPGLYSALLERLDPSVRIATPADPIRSGLALDRMLSTSDRCQLLVASKHDLPTYPTDTVEVELDRGAAVWPLLSDWGDPDLVLAAAGDVAAMHLAAALPAIRAALPGLRVRHVHVHELTALGDPGLLPHALAPNEVCEVFGAHCPVLLLVPCFASPVAGLVATRHDGFANRITVRGYRDPGRPMTPAALAQHCGFDPPALAEMASGLLHEEPTG